MRQSWTARDGEDFTPVTACPYKSSIVINSNQFFLWSFPYITPHCSKAAVCMCMCMCVCVCLRSTALAKQRRMEKSNSQRTLSDVHTEWWTHLPLSESNYLPHKSFKRLKVTCALDIKGHTRNPYLEREERTLKLTKTLGKGVRRRAWGLLGEMHFWEKLWLVEPLREEKEKT